MATTAVETSPSREEPERTLRDEFVELHRDVMDLVRSETELAAATHSQQARRIGRDITGVVALALALITAFALVNVAIVLALATVLASWASALIVALAWAAVAGVSALVIAHGTGGATLRRLRASGAARPTADLRAARDAARRRVQHDLEAIAPPLTERAIEAAVPIATEVAGRMAIGTAGEAVEEVADGVEDVGRELVEESEEIVETLAEDLPGASVASTIWDVALLPGRTGVRIATTVLKRPGSHDRDD